ncbi:hypothetical protein E0485_15195 [Paenibacillus albiflavus]|uniref:Uncharacterized protein n=1 Tax=Paenibacillus albiflavus TaxID=2545760 RepID=A0A4R4EB70_9BACL|nr:hypothetical protein [Paenibacillus albiflavus]TCZ76180.1 hypothetical protein E0485_15195 [Paenibacillus albiflavus]
MLTKAEAREKAQRNWAMWRLLLSDMNITYSDLDKMSPEDLAEANAALDIHIELIEKQKKK